MTTRTEYGVRYTGYSNGKDTTFIVEPLDATSRAEAEKSRDATRTWQAATEGELPVDAVIVTRTVTTTDWEPQTSRGFKVGDPVTYQGEPGWEFAGPDTTIPHTIRKGLVMLKWVESARIIIAYGVDPANLAPDTTQTSEDVV